MKKLITLFLGLALAVSFVSAQSYWDKYLINENFNGWLTWPSGWSGAATSGGSTTIGDSIRFSGSGPGNRGAEVIFPADRDSSIIHANFDLYVSSAYVAFKNALGLFLCGTNSGVIGSSTSFTDLIASVYLAGNSKKFHVWNMDIRGPVPVEKPDTIIPVFSPGRFDRPGASNTVCDSLNLSTKTLVDYKVSTWYNLSFELNFTTKKMDLIITEKNNVLNTDTLRNLNFISQTANDLKRIGLINTRSSTLGNGSNASLTTYIDNMKIYRKVLSQGKADVAINYIDQDGSIAKTERVEPAREVNVTYKLPDSDKVSFVENNFYYAYDAVATGADSVIVAPLGSAITVKFKKTALTAGTYNWNGNVSENWNEIDANFTANGNQIGYQNGNGVTFSDPNALFKTALVNTTIDLGANGITFDSPGFNIGGSGKLLGTGTVTVNANAKIAAQSNMTGGIFINKDTLQVGHLKVTNKYTVKDGTALNTLAGVGNFSTPIEGTGMFTLIPTENSTYSSAIKGVSHLNYVLLTKGSPAATSKGLPTLNNIVDSATHINVKNSKATLSYFGSTISFPKAKIQLGDSVQMVYVTAPLADGTTNIAIGELTGSTTSSLIGCFVRKMTYSVGGLSTDAVYDGVFKPITTAYWGTSATDKSQTNFNINKIGKGKWTLNGSSPKFFGNVKVLDGTLIVNDTLCNATGEYVFGTTTLTTVPNKIPELMVADTATLAGKGFIGATSTVLNGTITGNLTLAGSISMKAASGENIGAKTIINVSSTAVDKITVLGDLYYGGRLIVKVNSLPQPGDYQILQFASMLESGPNGFDSIELPSANWAFDYTTGVLKYKGGDESAVNAIDYSKQIESIRYFDITGKQVTKNHIGFVFMKVKYTDGTTASVKTFVKK